MAAQQLEQQILLGADVVVERAALQPGGLTDLRDAGSVVPLLGEQPRRPAARARACPLVALGPRPGAGQIAGMNSRT